MPGIFYRMAVCSQPGGEGRWLHHTVQGIRFIMWAAPLSAHGPKITLHPSTWWRWAALCIPCGIRTERAVSSAQIRLGLPSLKTSPPSAPTVWVNPGRQEKQEPYPCMTEDPHLNSMQLLFLTPLIRIVMIVATNHYHWERACVLKCVWVYECYSVWCFPAQLKLVDRCKCRDL